MSDTAFFMKTQNHCPVFDPNLSRFSFVRISQLVVNDTIMIDFGKWGRKNSAVQT